MFDQLMKYDFSTGMIFIAPVYIPGCYTNMNHKYNLIWDLNDKSVSYETYKVAILSESLYSEFNITLTENQGHRIGKKTAEYILLIFKQSNKD